MSSIEDTGDFQLRVSNSLNNAFSRPIKNILDDDTLNAEFNGQLINDTIVKTEESMKFLDAYSPESDVAVGPFSYIEGNNLNIIYKKLIKLPEIASFILKLKEKSLVRFSNNKYNFGFNKNPRCFISFEIENSTADKIKYVLGSLSNASFMGKIGVVVFYDRSKKSISRLIGYLHTVEEIKLQRKLFNNAFLISKTNFDNILSDLASQN